MIQVYESSHSFVPNTFTVPNTIEAFYRSDFYTQGGSFMNILYLLNNRETLEVGANRVGMARILCTYGMDDRQIRSMESILDISTFGVREKKVAINNPFPGFIKHYLVSAGLKLAIENEPYSIEGYKFPNTGAPLVGMIFIGSFVFKETRDPSRYKL